jgi:ABC transport system ATP-binding/permease protein
LLLVSHDRAFLDNVVTSTLVFEGAGQVNEYVGGYSDWLRQRRAAAPAATRVTAVQSSVAQSAASAAPAAPSAARARRLSYKDQRELEAMPQKIQGLESEQLELQAQIADPALFKADPARAAAALTRLQALSAEIENAYSRWDALEP